MQIESPNKRDAAQLRQDFQQFLATGGYCTPPGRAGCALSRARTLQRWRELEAQGFARLKAEPDQTPYDPGDCDRAYVNIYGRHVSEEEAKKEIADMIERDGVWCVDAEWNDGFKWQHADSICGCAGYSNPCDPFQNDYVTDLMDSAIKAWEAHIEDMAGAV